ncbi:hypothetical protein TNCV_532931 [Trichonephila clavipes]|nr:hypothetical protein TNCV_532931 [Trichonephila clavipes]
MWYQHDGVPAHKSAQPCTFWAQTFDTRIIGHGGQEVAKATGGVSDVAPAKVVIFRVSQAAVLVLSSNTFTPIALTQLSADLKLQSSSHMAKLWPFSGSQVMLGSPAMCVREPTKKPSREPSRINRKFP